MKKIIILSMIFVATWLSSFVQIYDIQYTNTPGEDGYYPSNYVGEEVETGGIVTGINFSEGRYFISSAEGGAWNGLYIYDNDHFPEIGDELLLAGEIVEYYGFTELSYLSSYQLISTDNELPDPTTISCTEVDEEQFESIFVEIENVTISESYDQWSQWAVEDEGGECQVGVGFYNFQEDNFPLFLDYPIASISGIISFSWQEFVLHPRNYSDLESMENGEILSINSESFYGENEIEIPLYLSTMGSGNAEEYLLNIGFDSSVVNYLGFNADATLSSGGEIAEDIFDSNIILTYSGIFSYENSQELIKLNFGILGNGNANLEILSAEFDGQNCNYIFSGEIIIDNDVMAIGDTLTTIQRPILNIPEIVMPNEPFTIWCDAPENTENWEAELFYENIVVNLQISDESYEPELNRWSLIAISPQPELFELYDLHVTGSGNIDDTSENAVKIISQELEDYYFVHISDTHLPTHYFWSDNPELALNDTTEIEDLRQVINDINILNPEFVIFTGDVVNEGELEDFGNGRCYTKAQKIISEFEVPVYVVSGNHDLGGWDATPPSQGTSRRDWWRFFGWSWLANASGNSIYRTQDYSFDYGDTRFIGLEAYDNYDGYMYEIYGENSFIITQMNWLDIELNNSENYSNRVLFYHYDFSDQIDLSSLGVDMALWGHIHSDSGDINQYPYNLAVDNVCDETQAYRVIKVSDNQLEPQNTLYANWGGDNLNISYSPENNGMSYSMTGTITNNQNVSFENSLIKFKMPSNCSSFIVENGVLEQVYEFDQYKTCYVKVDVEANSSIDVSITGSSSLEEDVIDEFNFNFYPNPFRSFKGGLTINFSKSEAEEANLEIDFYNIKGQKVRNILIKDSVGINRTISWDGKDEQGKYLASGIYFTQLMMNDKIVAKRKLLLIK